MIAGGGTGGHVIPALAIAVRCAISIRAEVCFIGTARGMETRLVPQAGYALELIACRPAQPMSAWLRKLRTAGRVCRAASCTALGFCARWQPQVVVGVGGYASGPAMLAALLLRIRLWPSNQMPCPGLANRLIGKRISAAAVNFAPTRRFFRNAEVTGIPVRAEFFALPQRLPQRAPQHLLVMGGSQGARALNQKMPQIAKALLEAVPRSHHPASGRRPPRRNHRRQPTRPAERPRRWRGTGLSRRHARTVCGIGSDSRRSGASTVAELAASGKPSLLVPFPTRRTITSERMR